MAGAHALVEFRLTDQFGRSHAADEYRGGVVVLVGSDRAGSRFVPPWIAAVRDALAGEPAWERIRTLGVADLRGTPSFLRPMIGALLQRTAQACVLLDWEGVVARAYDFVPGECNVIVVDREGRLALQLSGRGVERVRAGLLGQRLRALLRANGGAAEPPPA
jgi:hypothetical protein